MDNARKKDLVREYKEAKQRAGIFAVTCKASGERWVTSTRNLDKAQNPIWFSLRLGSYINKAAQAAWNAHGAESFSFDVLEEVTDDNALIIGELLKERDIHWRKELGAGKLVG